jgi:hypothetical protein
MKTKHEDQNYQSSIVDNHGKSLRYWFNGK